jgi:hypothetical protein
VSSHAPDSGLLMLQKLVTYGPYVASTFLQVALVFTILHRRLWKRLGDVLLYVTALLLIDGATRSFVLHKYGFSSNEYAYTFWLTDVLLALASFLLVCSLFRRACRHEEKMWRFLRLFLALVFILVLGISSTSLIHNYDNLFSYFIVQFQQNLYFTCLVLNTLLYVLLQQTQNVDEELGLLVTGMGIQFAGPAASLALLYLAQGQEFARALVAYLGPLCTVGMLLTWFYAVTRIPQTAAIPARQAKPVEFDAAAPHEA